MKLIHIDGVWLKGYKDTENRWQGVCNLLSMKGDGFMVVQDYSKDNRLDGEILKYERYN